MIPRVKMQFDDDDQALLMLLAGELPAADAQLLAKRLEQDLALRQRYAHLAETLHNFHDALASADAAEPLNSSPVSSARQFAKSMRQIQADRLALPARPLRARKLIPTWAYPLSAAALFVIGFLLWWTYRAAAPENVAQNTPQITAPATAPALAESTPSAPTSSEPAAPAVAEQAHPNTAQPTSDQPVLTDNTDADSNELAVAQVLVADLDPAGDRPRRGSSMNLDAAERDAAALNVLSSSVISDDSVHP